MAVLEVEGAVGTDAGGVALAVVAALPHELLVGAQQVVGDELGELAARPVLAAAATSATDGMSGALVGVGEPEDPAQHGVGGVDESLAALLEQGVDLVIDANGRSHGVFLSRCGPEGSQSACGTV